jgi:DNA-binding MurR/RpiR family transcriptional regulator
MGMTQDLRERFAELSPALQQVAKYVLDHPNDVVTSSMRTVGTRAGGTPATLVRFAQHLGYSGWPQLKAALTAEMGLGPEPYGQRAKQLLGRASDRTLTDEMFQVQRHNLETTQRHIEGKLQRACSLLERARAVHVAGFRACFPIAFSFVYLYRLFRPGVHLIDGAGGTLEMQQRALAKGDALVVISFAPYSREALQAAQAAKAAGAKVLAVADSIASPVSLLADETLLFSIRSPSFFPSIAAGVAVTEALVEMLASRAGKSVVSAIDETEAKLFESGAYLQAPEARLG